MRSRKSKYNNLVKRFVMNSLGIDSIKNEEFYILGWMIDLMAILISGVNVLNNKTGWNLVVFITGILIMALLIWLGKTKGVKKNPESQDTPEDEAVAVSVLLLKETVKKLNRMKIDPSNIEQFSIYINESIEEQL